MLESSRYKRISNQYNSLPLTTLYNNNAAITAGYRNKGATSQWTTFAHYAFDCKHGDEHVAGDAIAGVYPVLADLTMYKHYRTTAYAGAMFTALSRSQWTIRAKLGLHFQPFKICLSEQKNKLFAHLHRSYHTAVVAHWQTLAYRLPTNGSLFRKGKCNQLICHTPTWNPSLCRW